MKKFIGIILIIICIIVAGFCGLQWRSYQKLEDAYEEGLLYFNEKDYEKSEEIFENASSIHSIFDSDLSETMLGYRAEGYYNLGKYDEAVALYDQLIEADSDTAVYYTMKGLCYQKAGNADKAKETFETGWEKTKELSFLESLCEISIEEDDVETALSYINEGLAVAEGEDAKTFLFDKIVVYEKTQDYDSAYEAAAEFHEKYPSDEKGEKEYIFLSTRI